VLQLIGGQAAAVKIVPLGMIEIQASARPTSESVPIRRNRNCIIPKNETGRTFWRRLSPVLYVRYFRDISRGSHSA